MTGSEKKEAIMSEVNRWWRCGHTSPLCAALKAACSILGDTKTPVEPVNKPLIDQLKFWP